MKFSAKLLGCSTILSAVLATTAYANDCQDIVDIACSLDDFSTLCTAVQEADLAGALSEGHWTVFAPTNQAFSELGELLETVLADKDLLTDILLYHAIPEVIGSGDLECTARVEMANGKNSRTVCENNAIYQKGGRNPRNDMPEIIQTDIETCQGFIHVVDEVLLPGRLDSPTPRPPEPACQTIAEIACGTPDFSTLCSAVVMAGLDGALSDGTWTVFAPTNDAFGKLDPSLLQAVLSDTALLTNVLLFHVVADKTLFVADLECAHILHMASGDDSRTVCHDYAIFQKGGGNPRSAMPEIVDTDIGACNGVIHVIDEVMLP